MKKVILAIFAAFCCAVSSYAADSCPKGWTLDIDAALKQAKAENKKVLLLFTGSDWCGWCIKLKREVLEKNEFKKFAKKNLVLVYFDFPSKKKISDRQMVIQQQWQNRFKVRGFPTVVILDAQGNQIGTIGGGGMNVKDYVNRLKQIINGKRK